MAGQTESKTGRRWMSRSIPNQARVVETRTEMNGFILKQTKIGERGDGEQKLDFTETRERLERGFIVFTQTKKGQRMALTGFHTNGEQMLRLGSKEAEDVREERFTAGGGSGDS
uniref:Uncharacterized protein n=1 Tax=Cucumis melo TaxID=3656 RepID=A0A9I9DPI1_CUCME